MKYSILNSVFVFWLICGCHSPSNKITIDVSDKNLSLNNGILFHDHSPFNGAVILKYDSGGIRSEMEYTDGKKHGTEIKWNENGDKVLERFYTNGFKTGIHKSWWEKGHLKFEYHFNDKGMHHGPMKEWYQSGQPLRVFNYENGKEVGPQRLWKPDGSIKANYEVLNGERFGLIGLKKCYTVTVNQDEIK
ncbi:toxin-antitoxin system YwqK family antitoxin [Hyunsoonleella rubra]|uniref:Toxin-antitoxin system YwqK family antitoxin n=1 Tax=Hyunsoonleella rubra TaxID=1737062 RepID=A0ABW5TFA6_9FLAO